MSDERGMDEDEPKICHDFYILNKNVLLLLHFFY
jgi:hypothetical protein